MTKEVLISAVLGAVVGAGVALLVRPKAFQIFTVSVNSQAPKLSVNPLPIWKGNKDEVRWFANAGSNLYVEFEQQIFANATLQPNGRYRVKCNANVCDSGRILATLPPPPNPLPPDLPGYRYWFGLSNSPTSPPPWDPNGRIIINP